MPAGVTWGQYIKFFTSALMCMMVGSQLVHMYYKPLKDIDEYVHNELKNKNNQYTMRPIGK